jgi:hypothetical protein
MLVRAGRLEREQRLVGDAAVRERMQARHGKKRGTKIAAIEIARRLAEANWHMLTTNTPFTPAGAPASLAA